jgi:hypothetical protein
MQPHQRIEPVLVHHHHVYPTQQFARLADTTFDPRVRAMVSGDAPADTPLDASDAAPVAGPVADERLATIGGECTLELLWW